MCGEAKGKIAESLSREHVVVIHKGMDFFFNYYFLKLFIYLFLAALGLRCCAQAFSSCGERGLLFIAVRGLLIMVASLVEHRL